jgi:hypothetical protein
MANNKRLIYAEDALVGLQYISMFGDVNDNMIQGAMRLARSKIENAPTVDAVEVVRCKDCKQSYEGVANLMCGRCGQNINGIRLGGVSVKEEHFCAYGERKQNVGEK